MLQRAYTMHMKRINCSSLLLTIGLFACSGAVDESTGVSGPRPDEPYLIQEGIKYPYLQYETDNGQGVLFFTFPIFDEKNKGLLLEYHVGDDLKSLFANDMMGENFYVVRNSAGVHIADLPISIPEDVSVNSVWRIQYFGNDFKCKIESKNLEVYEISCKSDGVTLKSSFDSTIGITQYQEPCKSGVCTYKLKTKSGLLSATQQESLPNSKS